MVSLHTGSGGTETAFTPGTAREVLHHDELCHLYPLDHELGDAVTAFDLVGSSRIRVVQHHTDLTPIPSINRTWGVENCDSVFCREPRTGVDEADITSWQCHGDPGRNEASATSGDLDLLTCMQVQPGIPRPSVCRHRQALIESLEQHRHGFVVSTTLFYICHSTDPTGIRVILETC